MLIIPFKLLEIGTGDVEDVISFEPENSSGLTGDDEVAAADCIFVVSQ